MIIITEGRHGVPIQGTCSRRIPGQRFCEHNHGVAHMSGKDVEIQRGD